MKKDRNAFFESSQMSSSFTPNMMPMPMQQGMMPYQASQNSSSFYAGPDIPFNTYPSNMNSNDYEAKISRLERQMQKLDNRITKLENKAFNTVNNDEVNISSNMYMI